jgi:hypothetical protein
LERLVRSPRQHGELLVDVGLPVGGPPLCIEFQELVLEKESGRFGKKVGGPEKIVGVLEKTVGGSKKKVAGLKTKLGGLGKKLGSGRNWAVRKRKWAVQPRIGVSGYETRQFGKETGRLIDDLEILIDCVHIPRETYVSNLKRQSSGLKAIFGSQEDTLQVLLCLVNRGYISRITQDIRGSRGQKPSALGRSFVNDRSRSLAD